MQNCSHSLSIRSSLELCFNKIVYVVSNRLWSQTVYAFDFHHFWVFRQNRIALDVLSPDTDAWTDVETS